MKWSAEKDDLSLLPHMTSNDKRILRGFGITAVSDLATLKEFGKINSCSTPDV
jgi:predicted RecB family nuclease